MHRQKKQNQQQHFSIYSKHPFLTNHILKVRIILGKYGNAF